MKNKRKITFKRQSQPPPEYEIYWQAVMAHYNNFLTTNTMIGKDFYKPDIRGKKEHWYVMEKDEKQENGEDVYLCCIFWQRHQFWHTENGKSVGRRISYFLESEIKRILFPQEDLNAEMRKFLGNTHN